MGLVVMSTMGQDHQTELLPKSTETTPQDQDEATVEDEQPAQNTDVKKVFIPTKEWQTVEEDQTLLPGLHIRMNLQTGKKEAKLLDDDDGTEYQQSLERMRKAGHTGLSQAVMLSQSQEDKESEDKPVDPQEEARAALMRESVIEALKHIKSDDGPTPQNEQTASKAKYRSYKQLKEDFDELNLKMETDLDILTRLMSQYQATSSDDERAIILEDLEYLVHQFDNAINFIDMGGLKDIVMPGINSSSTEVKEGAFHLLGSAVQSNPKVQIAAVEAGLVQALIQALEYNAQEGVARKAMFAVSCLVRGFPYGQQVLVQSGGMEALRRLFDRHDFQSLPLQLKVVALLHDLLVEREQAEGERLLQLRRFKLDDRLATGGWCPAVSSLLTVASFDRRDRRYDMGAALKNQMPLRPDHDTVDKVVSAMGSMVRFCRYQFYDTLPLLRHLAHTYDDLAYKEQFQNTDDDEGHGLFRGMAETIQRLVKDIGQKNEL
ncbi:hypothetical protein Pmani_036906 [Petrolisthes manimaculis]|uniref:Nucleotide exchange factor SIL1 n=1 Tax=Petrolisthes manimaculis TaxID=1843537 RepID=A0AAE1NK87_9EUCA|nr:hypothetical protein Pmani_036906 [Petrolisthes manimaculis]